MMRALPPAARYSIAVLLAVVAQLARIPLHSPTVIPFITYAPFVLLSAYLGGWGPGVLTTILCSIESLYFAVAPVLTFRVDDTANWVGMGSLVLTGVVASGLFERLRRVQQAAAKAERERSEMERASWRRGGGCSSPSLNTHRYRLRCSAGAISASRWSTRRTSRWRRASR
jgi:K+-sensing histidine kinase KdpD